MSILDYEGFETIGGPIDAFERAWSAKPGVNNTMLASSTEGAWTDGLALARNASVEAAGHRVNLGFLGKGIALSYKGRVSANTGNRNAAGTAINGYTLSYGNGKYWARTSTLVLSGTDPFNVYNGGPITYGIGSDDTVYYSEADNLYYLIAYTTSHGLWTALSPDATWTQRALSPGITFNASSRPVTVGSEAIVMSSAGTLTAVRIATGVTRTLTGYGTNPAGIIVSPVVNGTQILVPRGFGVAKALLSDLTTWTLESQISENPIVSAATNEAGTKIVAVDSWARVFTSIDSGQTYTMHNLGIPSTAADPYKSLVVYKNGAFVVASQRVGKKLLYLTRDCIHFEEQNQISVRETLQTAPFAVKFLSVVGDYIEYWDNSQDQYLFDGYNWKLVEFTNLASGIQTGRVNTGVANGPSNVARIFGYSTAVTMGANNSSFDVYGLGTVTPVVLPTNKYHTFETSIEAIPDSVQYKATYTIDGEHSFEHIATPGMAPVAMPSAIIGNSELSQCVAYTPGSSTQRLLTLGSDQVWDSVDNPYPRYPTAFNSMAVSDTGRVVGLSGLGDIYESLDQCRTWSYVSSVVSRAVGQAHIAVSGDGQTVACLIPGTGAATTCSIHISTDAGLTFTERVDATVGYGTWVFAMSKNGEYVTYAAGTSASATSWIILKRSTDWAQTIIATPAGFGGVPYGVGISDSGQYVSLFGTRSTNIREVLVSQNYGATLGQRPIVTINGDAVKAFAMSSDGSTIAAHYHNTNMISRDYGATFAVYSPGVAGSVVLLNTDGSIFRIADAFNEYVSRDGGRTTVKQTNAAFAASTVQFLWQSGSMTAIDDLALSDFNLPNPGPAGEVIIRKKEQDLTIQGQMQPYYPEGMEGTSNVEAGARVPASNSRQYYVEPINVDDKDIYGSSASVPIPAGLAPLAVKVEAAFERTFPVIPKVQVGLQVNDVSDLSTVIPITSNLGSNTIASKMLTINPKTGEAWKPEDIQFVESVIINK